MNFVVTISAVELVNGAVGTSDGNDIQHIDVRGVCVCERMLSRVQ